MGVVISSKVNTVISNMLCPWWTFFKEMKRSKAKEVVIPSVANIGSIFTLVRLVKTPLPLVNVTKMSFVHVSVEKLNEASLLSVKPCLSRNF